MEIGRDRLLSQFRILSIKRMQYTVLKCKPHEQCFRSVLSYNFLPIFHWPSVKNMRWKELATRTHQEMR